MIGSADINKKLYYVKKSAKSASDNRTLPFTPRAIALLEHQQQERINEWVFNNVDNERLSYEALRHQMRRLCEEAKIEYRGEHVFRHTFATNCYYKGVNVKVLSKLFGHADVNVTYNIYIR